MYTWKGILGHIFMRICGMFPLQDKVVFSCFDGKMYSDNPRAIYRKMAELCGDRLTYIWLMNDVRKEIPGATVVKSASLLSLYHLSTAKLWIDNSRKRVWIVKRKGQYYVQAWHGDVCLKAIEKDAADYLGEKYVAEAIHDSKMADLMISGCKWKTENYRNAFWYDGEILEAGTPKSDIFYEDPQEVINKVRSYFGFPSKIRIALYVPTFRTNDDLSCYNIDYNRVLKTLSNYWGGDWVIVIRLHPKIQHLQNRLLYEDRIINGSEYEDADDLIIASDLILTDYSGCMFSGLEARKKVILYVPDLEDYQADRKLYFNFEDLPFPFSRSNDELIESIINFDTKLYDAQCEQFKETCGFVNSSNSSQKVTEYIYKAVWC